MDLRQLSEIITPPQSGQAPAQIRTGAVVSQSGSMVMVELSESPTPATATDGLSYAPGTDVMVLTTPDRAIVLGTAEDVANIITGGTDVSNDNTSGLLILKDGSGTFNMDGNEAQSFDAAGNPAGWSVQPFGGGLRIGGGDTGGSVLRFENNNTNIYRWDTNEIRMGLNNGTAHLRFVRQFSNRVDIISFVDNFAVGNQDSVAFGTAEYILFNGNDNRVDIFRQGNLAARFDGFVYFPDVYNDTSTNDTNHVRVTTTGRLQRLTSSMNVKANFRPIDSPTVKLMALDPGEYESLIPGENGASRIGFGAEQAHSVDERFAVIEEDESMPGGVTGSLNDSAILATTVATVQEQQAIIEAQDARIAALEAQVAALVEAAGPLPDPGV